MSTPQDWRRNIRFWSRSFYLVMTLLCISRAAVYSSVVHTPEEPPAAIELLAEIVPMDALAVVWLLVAIPTVIGVIRPRTWCLIGSGALCFGWAMAYLAGWLFGVQQSGYASAIVWLALAVAHVGGLVITARAIQAVGSRG